VVVVSPQQIDRLIAVLERLAAVAERGILVDHVHPVGPTYPQPVPAPSPNTVPLWQGPTTTGAS
jgi:hypothetical protein